MVTRKLTRALWPGLATLILSGAAPAAAQQAAPAGAPPQAAAQTGGPSLRLTMEQAVQMALETNLNLKSQRLNLDVASQNIVGAAAAFKPLLSSSFQSRTSDQVPASFTDSAGSVISSSNLNGQVSFSQALPWYGGAYQVTWQNTRSTTTAFSTFNPTLTSAVTVGYQQPLLRGFLIDQNRVSLETAQRQREIADIDLESQIVATSSQVKAAYINLIAANAGLGVAQENMDLARRQLSREQSMVAVGAAAPVDVIQLETQVASEEEQIIISQQQVADAQDLLRSLILDPNRADYWQVQFDVADQIDVPKRDIDVEAAVKSALTSRLDLQEARRNMGITDLNLKLDENLRRPALTASAQYSATGTGGTQFSFGDGFPPPILSETVRPYSSVLGDTFLGAYPTWTFGLSLAYPIGHTAADAALARGRLQRDQQAIAIRQLELQVTNDVRQAARNVTTSYQRVQATLAASSAAQRQLDAEQKKFEAGLSDSFTVVLKQQTLAQARINELNAKISYSQALQTFDRVQKIH